MFLLVSTLSIFLIFRLFPFSRSLLHLNLVIGYDLDNLNISSSFLFFSRNFLFNILVAMASTNEQEYMCVLGDLELLATKFMILAQENQRLLKYLQQVNVYKAHWHEELTKRFHQLEVTLVTLWQQALGVPSSPKDPKISPLTKFDGNQYQFSRISKPIAFNITNGSHSVSN